MILELYRRFMVFIDWLCIHVYVRTFEVAGVENVPLEGPLIVASNHLNNADPPVIILAFPRHPMFMAKREMLRWPILGPAFRIFGAFPVRRSGADLSAIRAASELVNDGKMLVMFPEGTRSRTGGLTRGHPGTGLVALRTNAPVIPVAITGSQDIGWPWIFLKPLSVKRITVTIGKPFHVEPVERPDGDAAMAATAEIMRHVAALLPPDYRGVYADPVAEPSVAAT